MTDMDLNEELKKILVYNHHYATDVSESTLCWHRCSSELAMSDEMPWLHVMRQPQVQKPTGVVESAHLISSATSSLERHFIFMQTIALNPTSHKYS